MINKLAAYYKVGHADLQQIEQALLALAPQVHQRIASATSPHVRVMVLVDGAADQTPHVTSQGYAPTTLRAFLEFGYEEAPLGSLVEIAGALLAPVAAIADAQGSCALAGREYVFCPGEMSHTLRVFMGRSLDTSFEDFHSHWLNRHGWLVKPRVDNRNGAYRQFHADPKASFLAARAAGVGRHTFEGTAEGFAPDVETYLRAMSRAGSDILEDEKRFMSARDTEVGLYRIALHLS
jgi:hypothetical protein